MDKNKPKRLVTFGNNEWSHWVVVSSFIILGIILTIIPSVYANKILWGPLIIGILSLIIGIFCVVDHIIFKKRAQIYEQQKQNGNTFVNKNATEYDIKAEVINLRKSGNPFANNYRPMFKISNKQPYLTTGQISFKDENFMLTVNEKTEAYISFLSPEVYPHTLWVGKVVQFFEGENLTGEAKVLEIHNKLLETDENNEEIINIK